MADRSKYKNLSSENKTMEELLFDMLEQLENIHAELLIARNDKEVELKKKKMDAEYRKTSRK